MTIRTQDVSRTLRAGMGAQAADALGNLLIQQRTGYIPVPLGAVTQEDGTALLKQATTVSGYLQVSNKETVIDIPVDCSEGEALGFSTMLPGDIDITESLYVKVLASKVEGGTPDALTLDAEIYINKAGDVANADAYAGAAQTIVAAGTVLSYEALPATLLAGPASVSVVLTLGGTNDADAVYIRAIWLEYTKV